MRVDEHTIELASSPVFLRRAAGPEPQPLYLHSVPTSSDDWVALLERTGGLAPDLPGFGRTGKGGQLDLSLQGYADFVLALLDALEIEWVQLVGHCWGAAAGLLFAQRHPERVARLALVNPLVPDPALQWPRISRLLRAPVLGELAMGAVNQRLLARVLRSGASTPVAWPDDRVRLVWEQFDQGTQRAILRLHRSASAEALAAVSQHLDQLRMPTLVVWGEGDPWLARGTGEQLAGRLAAARFVSVAEAGHWPWLESPESIASLTSFLDGG